jgi:HlyD family secretion protein
VCAPAAGERRPRRPAATPAEELPAGQTRKEIEGVFVVQNGVAHFRPVKVGITGDEYFEITSGLQAGDSIVAGTYQAIRDLKDGTKVKASEAPPMTGAKS